MTLSNSSVISKTPFIKVDFMSTSLHSVFHQSHLLCTGIIIPRMILMSQFYLVEICIGQHASVC